MSDAAPSPFSSALAREVLGKACETVGLSADDARLVRLGSNAIFELRRTPVVVRIGRSAERMPIFGRELCVARWLDDRSVPAVRPYDEVEQPLDVNGHPVSFWRRVDQGEPPPDAADLADLLRRFHAAGDAPCDLPAFDPLREVGGRIDAAVDVDEDDRDFLRRHEAQLRERYDDLVFELPSGPLHGDAYVGNLLGRKGAAVLLDFEATSVGPREWDLTPVAVANRRVGLPDAEYRAFADAYGYDVTEWDGFPVLRGIREVAMTTWLMQNVAEGPEVAAEFALRVRSMRDGDETVEWHAF
ncbi:phosphotransferase enzyme family protein [Plantactinospora sp. GCM10030261]|uniref:phosphotransferase enzyme family protein n=1 Tax=Plantactinospora sp. GCM10030261 TaxID=3273420 RepID=UPI0036185AC4